jgi:hypothetical protein
MRKKWLKLFGILVTLVSTALGGVFMIERGSVRPGLLMIAAGLVTAVIMLRKYIREKSTQEL